MTHFNSFKIAAILLVTLNGAVCLAEDNIALGRPYTFGHAPNYVYSTGPGNATDLTDGHHMVSESASFPAFWMADRKSRAQDSKIFSIGTAAGWTGGDRHKNIEIDLGEICSISGVTFGACAGMEGTDGHFAFPTSIMVFLSDDGSTYSYAGEMIDPNAIYKEAYENGKFSIETFELKELSDQARFVRLQMVQDGAYLFVDEIEVFGSKTAGLEKRIRELAGDAVPAFVKERVPPAPKKSSEPVRTDSRNLALGRPYSFPTGHAPNYWYCVDPGDATDLTDGILGEATGTDKGSVGWASLAGNKHESVEIDLGQICSIEGLTFNSAPKYPVSVLVFLSDDGETYSYAGDIVNEALPHTSPHTFTLDGLTEQGRFVRVQLVNGGHYMYLDEIEVLGSKREELTPQSRGLTVDGVMQFAADRVPSLRQRNSSLGFLGHATSRLAEEPDTSKAAVGQAQDALEKIKTGIMARAKAETVNYRRGVPFTKLDGEIGKVMGAYLEATGRPGLQVIPADPWTPLLPFDGEASAAASETPMLMMKNEWGELAFNLINGTSEPMELSVTVTDVQADAIRLHEVKFVEASGFLMRADALVPLRGRMNLPAGLTRQLWLTIDSRGLEPGEYSGKIEVAGGGVPVTAPFAFTVTPIEMPEQSSLYINTWSYMHWRIPKALPEKVARDLREHYCNTQQVISNYMPFPQVDAEGNFTRPMDFTKLDEYMALLPGTKMWLLWTQFDSDHRSMYPKEGEPRREKIFTRWLKDVIAHMKEKGYDYDEFAFEWIDEAGQKEMREIVKPSSELLRRIDPKALIWMNITGGMTEASVAEFEGLADIWCPTGDKLGWDFWKDKRTWTYESSSNKGRSPTGHYRYKLWKAFNDDCEGNGFWTYTDNLDSWDDYATTPGWGVIYDDPDDIVSSKRWDAYRAGIEDYEICKMLNDAIVAAKAAGKGKTAEIETAEKALEEWVKRVLDNKDDPMVAEQAHQELLKHLVKMSG